MGSVPVVVIVSLAVVGMLADASGKQPDSHFQGLEEVHCADGMLKFCPYETRSPRPSRIQ